MTLDLAKLRAETLALLDGTTPGPWLADPTQGEISSKEWAGYPVLWLDQSNYDRASNDIGLDNQARRDFSLAAAAPTLAADTLRLLDEIDRLRAVLEWYANPDVYKPHPQGLAFDRRDLSFIARAALAEGGSDAR